MKLPVVIIALLAVLAFGCKTKKETVSPSVTPAEEVPHGQLQVPAVLSANMERAEFCITLDPNFTYITFTNTIFNRWGQRVWTTDNPTACWDGKHMVNNEWEYVPAGVYVVLIQIQATNGKSYTNRSTLTFIR